MRTARRCRRRRPGRRRRGTGGTGGERTRACRVPRNSGDRVRRPRAKAASRRRLSAKVAAREMAAADAATRPDNGACHAHIAATLEPRLRPPPGPRAAADRAGRRRAGPGGSGRARPQRLARRVAAVAAGHAAGELVGAASVPRCRAGRNRRPTSAGAGAAARHRHDAAAAADCGASVCRCAWPEPFRPVARGTSGRAGTRALC